MYYIYISSVIMHHNMKLYNGKYWRLFRKYFIFFTILELFFSIVFIFTSLSMSYLNFGIFQRTIIVIIFSLVLISPIFIFIFYISLILPRYIIIDGNEIIFKSILKKDTVSKDECVDIKTISGEKSLCYLSDNHLNYYSLINISEDVIDSIRSEIIQDKSKFK